MNEEEPTLVESLLTRRNEREGRATEDLQGFPKGVAAFHAHSETTEPIKVLDGHAYPARFAVTYVGPRFGSVTMSFGWDGDRLICDGFTFGTTELHPEVKAGDLQQFPFLQFFEDAITRVALPEGHWAVAPHGPTPVDTVWPAPRGVVTSVNRRRQKVNAEALQRVAEIVREFPKAPYERADAVASRDAYSAICEEFNLGSARTAQLWVKRARDKGFLK